MDKKVHISVLGANPSWQKTLFFDDLHFGRVNRAGGEECYPSGKGVNFCRAVRCSGLAETAIFQFAGGDNGRLLCEGLDAAGMVHYTVNTDGATRNCITCLDRYGNMTELIGVSSPVSENEATKMLETLYRELPGSSILAITGSLPDGSSPLLYVKAAEIALKNHLPVLFDALAGVHEVLQLDGVIILKVNREEFFKITGQNDILAAHRWAAANFPGKIFAVTNGGDSATLGNDKYLYRYTLPQIKVTSPLGAGDTASAVMSALFAAGVPEYEAFKRALAAASANCLNATAGEFSIETAEKLAGEINYTAEKLL
ncbi:MAG: hypothetical protein E7058_09045 [Lentisphaerae bacterium]|nr:hypothetical protein [Lentisphaerota bacterium]